MKKHYFLESFLLGFFLFALQNFSNAQAALNVTTSTGAVSYSVTPAYFSADFNNESGDLVLVDDGMGTGSDGCEMMSGLGGKIALIDRGNCAFTQKALHAESAGAIAVVICNNVQENNFMMPGSTGGQTNIPVMILDLNSCNTIKTDLSGATASLTSPSPGETCISAISAAVGTNSVPEINSGFSATVTLGTHARWFHFTAASNLEININSCNQGVNTRLIVIPSADCEALSDHLFVMGGGLDASIDDCDDGTGSIIASDLTFQAAAGEGYFIIWDDAQSSDGFDFELTAESSGLVEMTFNVNMNEQNIDPIGVFVAGEFSNWLPEPMTDNGDGTYSRKYFLAEGATHEYKFLNGITGWETILGDCGSGNFNNRTVTVPDDGGQTDFFCFNLCAECPTCEDVYFAADDDFESYTVGDISSQSDMWTIWPGADLGGQVSTSYSSSGEQSVHISGADFTGQDVLLLLGDQTTGHFGVSWEMYIPANKEAYFNVQHAEATGNYAFTANFEIPTGHLDIWSQQIEFDFPHEQWFTVAVIFDLDNDLARLLVDDLLVHDWTFSVGDLEGDGTDPAPPNVTLGAINFYGFDDSAYDFYVDDLNYVVLPKPLEVQYCQTALPIAPGIHTVPDFDCLGGFDFDEDATSAAWFTFLPDTDGWISVSSCNNGGADTRVWIFSGSECPSLDIIGVNDDQCDDGGGSEFASYREAVVRGGETYWIVWDNPWDDTGFDFELEFYTTPPVAGDFCESAIPLDFGTHTISEYNGDAAIAGPNLGTDADLGQTAYVQSEWYSFTPDSDIMIDIYSCNLTSEDTRLWIYTGECGTLESLELIASSDDDCSFQSGIYNFEVTGGTTYYIEWDNNFNTDIAALGHDFVIEETPPQTVNVTFTVDMSLFVDFGGTISPEGMHFAGSIQGWNPSMSPMTNNGDGTWSITFDIVPGTEVFYKYVLGDDWADGNEGQTGTPLSDCGVDDGNDGFNRTEIIPDIDDLQYVACYDRCVTCDLVNVSEIDFENGVSVFPNPTSDVLNIQFDLPETTDFELRLTDKLGRVLIHKSFENTATGNSILDLSDFAKGVYILSFYSGDFVVSKRVILE